MYFLFLCVMSYTLSIYWCSFFFVHIVYSFLWHLHESRLVCSLLKATVYLKALRCISLCRRAAVCLSWSFLFFGVLNISGGKCNRGYCWPGYSLEGCTSQTVRASVVPYPGLCMFSKRLEFVIVWWHERKLLGKVKLKCLVGVSRAEAWGVFERIGCGLSIHSGFAVLPVTLLSNGCTCGYQN